MSYNYEHNHKHHDLNKQLDHNYNALLGLLCSYLH